MLTIYKVICIVLIFTSYVLAQDGKPDEFLSNPITLSVEVWEVLLESNSRLPISKNEPFKLKVPENPEQESYEIITDTEGEVHLLGFDLGVEEPVCESYLFRRSKLWGVFGSRAVLEQCSKEDNYFQCQALEGTVTHKNCGEHVTETGDAVIIEMGTWYTVSYYPEIDMTVLVVPEGSAQIAAKVGEDLGPFTTITTEQVWVSQPKKPFKGLDIDLYGRVFEITFLPELTDRLAESGLDYPYTRIGELADIDNIDFPSDEIASYLPDELPHNFEFDGLLEQIPTTSP